MIKKINKAFTLIEIVVAITIFSIIMVFVAFIFSNVVMLSAKIDITRAMQENVKNIVETISDDILKNWIGGISSQTTDSSCFYPTTTNYIFWDKLCVWTNIYYISKEDLISWSYIRIPFNNIKNECSEIQNNCVLVKNLERLSNNQVSFDEFSFSLSNKEIPKLTINFIMKPAIWRWVTSDMIKESKLIFQTTISEKLIKTN